MFYRTKTILAKFIRDCLKEKFIQSNAFTVHVVTQSAESVHQQVAYVTEHNAVCPQRLPATPWVKCWILRISVRPDCLSYLP
jgi:hypothetical protein